MVDIDPSSNNNANQQYHSNGEAKLAQNARAHTRTELLQRRKTDFMIEAEKTAPYVPGSYRPSQIPSKNAKRDALQDRPQTAPAGGLGGSASSKSLTFQQIQEQKDLKANITTDPQYRDGSATSRRKNAIAPSEPEDYKSVKSALVEKRQRDLHASVVEKVNMVPIPYENESHEKAVMTRVPLWQAAYWPGRNERSPLDDPDVPVFSSFARDGIFVPEHNCKAYRVAKQKALTQRNKQRRPSTSAETFNPLEFFAQPLSSARKMKEQFQAELYSPKKSNRANRTARLSSRQVLADNSQPMAMARSQADNQSRRPSQDAQDSDIVVFSSREVDFSRDVQGYAIRMDEEAGEEAASPSRHPAVPPLPLKKFASASSLHRGQLYTAESAKSQHYQQESVMTPHLDQSMANEELRAFLSPAPPLSTAKGFESNAQRATSAHRPTSKSILSQQTVNVQPYKPESAQPIQFSIVTTSRTASRLSHVASGGIGVTDSLDQAFVQLHQALSQPKPTSPSKRAAATTMYSTGDSNQSSFREHSFSPRPGSVSRRSRPGSASRPHSSLSSRGGPVRTGGFG